MCAGITLHPENQTNATGQTVELTCDVYGTDTNDDLVYQWIKSGRRNDQSGQRNTQSGWRSLPEPVAVNGSNVLPITNATIDDSGMYNCVVFSTDNNSTEAKSNSASVTILGKYSYICMLHTIQYS